MRILNQVVLNILLHVSTYIRRVIHSLVREVLTSTFSTDYTFIIHIAYNIYSTAYLNLIYNIPITFL